MARLKINKAAKIRAMFETLGADARPKDVIAALAAKRVKVSSEQVSNIKAHLSDAKRGKRGQKYDLISLSDLQAAKRLVEALGSVEKASNALTALAKLR